MTKVEAGFSPKQIEFLRKKGKRLNFLVGSVRSGKTYVSLWKWALWILSQPKSYEFLMVGKTLMSLKRNCLTLLETFVGSNNFQYSLTSKSGYLFGHKIYLEGANDEKSESKIRGMTLAGAYCDEVTLFPESFFVMLLTRLSMPNAKLFATCNPDSPSHWVKEKYIDNADNLDCAVWTFLLTDNMYLSEEYLDNIRKEFQGVFYNRFILGQWVRAEGIVYPQFANNVEDYYLPENFNFGNIVKVSIGVDFGGNKSASTFVCTGFTKFMKDVIILEAERHPEELNPERLDELFANFVEMCTNKYGKASVTYADSAEQILIRGLRNTTIRKGLATNVVNAIKMPILDRIILVNKLINQHRFFVQKHCRTVINALCEAVWDEKKENERLDDFTSDIDTLDAMEYSIEKDYRLLTDYKV